jgi:purine-binding chemotaxis protein CheW
MNVLVFTINDVRYALPADAVAEMVRAVAIIPVAGAPRGVEGVCNVRGDIVPVVDVRARFGAPARALDPSQHFILVRLGARLVALRVDRIETLLAIDDVAFRRDDPVVRASAHVHGVVTLDDGLIVIYDVEAFLTQDEATALAPLLNAMVSA